MDISAFETKLNGLINEVSNVPEAKMSRTLLISSQFYSSKPQLSKTESVEQSLEHLRLIVKYLLFDIEATRRENKYLRKVLEGQDD